LNKTYPKGILVNVHSHGNTVIILLAKEMKIYIYALQTSELWTT